MINGQIDILEINGEINDYISLEGTLLPVGPKGDKGDPGEPGFSPQVDITKVGKVTTLTIVDQQGQHQSQIYDGVGDMEKSVYDTDNDGIVDNAEKVNNHTVLTDVPADAVFTDTTYTAGTGIEITSGNVINNTQTSAEWGNITGTLSSQTDLQNALDLKADASGLATVATTGSYTDLSNKPSIPTKTSDLNNDSGFITKAVNDLTNYYTSSNTYTKTEVNNLIGQINQFKIEVVQTLPVSDIDTHTIYLLPKTGTTGDVYDEYLYINNAWEVIGSTATDLSGYYTKTETDTLLSAKQGTLTAGSNIQINNNTISATDTTYQSKTASQGGTDVSLVTTGEKYTWNNKSDFSGSYNDLSNKPTIPDELADLSDDSTHRLVTDTEKTTWNGKQDALVSGTNIKTINNTSLLGSGDITIQANPEVAIQTTTPTNDEVLWIEPSLTPTIAGNKIAVVSGIVEVDGSSSSNIFSTSVNYPSGFNRDNCVVISVMSNNNGATNLSWSTPGLDRALNYVRGNIGTFASLNESDITLSVTKIEGSTTSPTINMKAVLMRIS